MARLVNMTHVHVKGECGEADAELLARQRHRQAISIWVQSNIPYTIPQSTVIYAGVCFRFTGRETINPFMVTGNYNATSNNMNWYTGR